MVFEELSLKEKIGQKFILGINSSNIDIIVDLIKRYYIGGVILYKKNYNNYKEMLSVVNRLKEANKNNKIPLFIAIDQEGGRVNRMPPEFNNIKNICDLSLVDRDLIYRDGYITGKMLSQTGINMNFAPVLDMSDDINNKLLYKRCFAGDISNVSMMGAEYIKGLSENGIIAVPKHFPGHGSSKADSHVFTPYVYNYKRILDRHIVPFKTVIENGIDAIMVSHLVIRGMTDGMPASISPNFADEYLREKNNFSGLVITDEMNMLSRNIFYKFNYIKKSILSGSDIILMKVNDNGSKILDKFIKLYSNNLEYIKLLDDSVRRIIDVKVKYNINDDTLCSGCNIEDINKEIDIINNLYLTNVNK